MSVVIAPLFLAILIAFASPIHALPLITARGVSHALRSESLDYVLQKRDDQGLTHGWSDLSGDAKAGVILAPTLALVFVLFAAFFVLKDHKKAAGDDKPLIPCFRRKNKKRVVRVAKLETSQTPGGRANTGVAAG